MDDFSTLRQTMRRVRYKISDDEGDLVFIPKCPNCGRYVKADPSVRYNEIKGVAKETNGYCAHCGRIEMRLECID